MENCFGNCDKEEACKGCPQINDCDNEPFNCLRKWNYMFTGKWS